MCALQAIVAVICVVSRDFGVQFTIIKLKLHSKKKCKMTPPKNGTFS